MKPLPPALRNGLLRMRRENASFATISKAFGVPVGTVKSVCSKEGVRKRMEPHAAKGKGRGMEPWRNVECGMRNVECRTLHRGLRVEDMPGRTGWERRMTWSLFRRGEWPPKEWRIPAELEGAALAEALGERAFKSKPRGEA